LVVPDGSAVPAPAVATPPIADLLAAAVADIGGAERPGQVTMAEAVRNAIETGEHLAVQAGTGTGKSLAYLVPAVAHAMSQRATVVVSTATIALQRQLIDRDLPRLAAALKPLLGRAPVFAILKGRSNYVCLHRLRVGAPDDPQEGLFDASSVSATGRQVQRLHDWGATTKTGDRDELVPGVPDRAWRQVSVSARECIGAHRCPYGTHCFAEKARERAGEADVVVTNHALLAVDALTEYQVLPDHDVVVIDEAHELVDRVTSIAAGELSSIAIDAAIHRCSRLIEDTASDRLKEAAEAFAPALADIPAGRLDVLPDALAAALALIRDAAGACAAAVRASVTQAEGDQELIASGQAAAPPLDELNETAARLLGAFDAAVAARTDVVWVDRFEGAEAQTPRPPTLCVAPLEVGDLLAEQLFGQRTVVLTSATLALGGSFEPLARQWGLPPVKTSASPPAAGEANSWSGIDVGSPFDHPRSGILYVARHLPPPGRDGLAAAYLDELRELIDAAGGRTLGLFSSMRAARQAADALRDGLGYPLLCQGEDATSQLVKQFSEDESTCLFGTLSLWQGVDVPGPSLRLVVIDRIPFPRPDDPLASARQRAIAARGGNGFMAVAATHAALLLAQGAGRLLRTMSDRGVVAVLDPRLVTARYSDFLRESLPPFWTTTNPDIPRAALRRLADSS
jgi:ATP-dependent DNA helicase DinG